jgi:hypothetical protein
MGRQYQWTSTWSLHTDGSYLKVNCVDCNIQGQCVYHFPSSESRDSENFDSRNIELRTQERELS